MAGSNNALKGNLPYFAFASSTPRMNPPTSAVLPLTSLGFHIASTLTKLGPGIDIGSNSS